MGSNQKRVTIKILFCLIPKFGLIVVSRSLAQVPNDSVDLGKNKRHVNLISFSSFMEMELWVCFIIFLFSSQEIHHFPQESFCAYSLTFLRALLLQVCWSEGLFLLHFCHASKHRWAKHIRKRNDTFPKTKCYSLSTTGKQWTKVLCDNLLLFRR